MVTVTICSEGSRIKRCMEFAKLVQGAAMRWRSERDLRLVGVASPCRHRAIASGMLV